MSIPINSCLILGGTGAVGKCLVRDALSSHAFTRVLALGRRPVPTDDGTFTNLEVLEQKTVNYDDIPDTFPKSDLPQVVFCTLGTTRALAGSAANFKKIDQGYVLDSARYIHEKAPKDPVTGLSKVHFVYCSSANANPDSFFLYPKTKGETEKALAEIGFERVSIFQPAFLKTVESRSSGNRSAEWIVDKFVPVLEFISEKMTTISVASVALAMRLAVTSATADVMDVSPKSVGINPRSKTKVVYFSNANIHDINNMASIKIAKNGPADEIELSVAQALYDLENNVADLKKDLKVLQISSAKEIETGNGKKAIVIFVPVPQLKAFHKIQGRLTRELEKKFSDRHVVFVAQRRIMAKPTRNSRAKQMRPRSRTLTSVHEKLLEDLVYPTEITGKRTRVQTDQKRIIKVFLDAKDSTSLEYKLDTFVAVYRRLTGKEVVFEFPAHHAE
ncbi:40S ribosomal protein [Linnemannia zychae]|nr:40S ribosomal protein [Linnemannia zychae]